MTWCMHMECNYHGTEMKCMVHANEVECNYLLVQR